MPGEGHQVPLRAPGMARRYRSSLRR